MLGWWIREKLGSKRADARLRALEALVEKEDRGAVDKVMEILVNDPELEVREKAAWALGELGGEREFEALFSGLAEDDGKCRQRIDGLIQIDYEATAIRVAGSGGLRAAKEVLLSLLPEIGDETAKRAMLELLSDSVYCVREGVAKGLRQLGWKPQSRREQILAAIAEGDWKSVPTFRKDAVEPLLGLLYPGSPVCREVIEALVRIGDEQAMEHLCGFIGEAGPGGHQVAEAAEATALLVTLLDSPELRVRATAAKTLRRLKWGPPDDSLAMRYAVACGDPGKALEYGEDARERLLETARNDDLPLSERWDFILALKDLEPEVVFGMLMSILERNTDGLGHRAAETLGELGDPRALEALFAEAQPPSVIDPKLMTAATKALAKFNDIHVTRFLLELQKSEDSVKLAVGLLREHLSLHAERINSAMLREMLSLEEIDQAVMDSEGGCHHEKVDRSVVKELAGRELERRASS